MKTSSVIAKHVPDESFTAASMTGPLMVQPIQMAQIEGISKEHKLASLSSLTGKAHLQRACVKCKPTFLKASYHCKSCGSEFVLCGPTAFSAGFQKGAVVGGPGDGPPETIFKLTVVLPIFFNSFTYKVGGNTPNEAGFIVPNYHLVRTDYL